MEMLPGLARGLLCLLLLSIAACSNDGPGLPDPCQPACGQHGLCDAFASPVACVCFPGWAGAACDACASGYADDGAGNCLPGQEPGTCTTGSCSGHGWCDDSTGAALCTCNPGYSGARCDTCQSGYHLDNLGGCAADVTCAQDDPCGDYGTCLDEAGTTRCVCDTGWAGDTCADCAAGYHATDDGCLADEHCPQVDPCAPGGSCDDAEGVVQCLCGTGYEGQYCDRCAPGYIDTGEGCQEGTSCEDFPFADDAYVYQMTLAGGDDACCFDFSNDGLPDNAYGDLLAAMSGLGTEMDVNQILADQIASGELCLIFDLQDLDSTSDDDAVGLSLFRGTDSDGVYEDNLDGSGEFTVDADSFLPGDSTCSMTPVNAFSSAALSDGLLTGQAVQAAGLSIPFPFVGDTRLDLPLQQVRLAAYLGTGPHGLLLTDGRLGGAIPMTALCTGLNDFVAENCGCLGLDGPLLGCAVADGAFQVTCNQSASSQCGAEPPESTCEVLENYCGILTALFELDVDSDGDEIDDAMSVGLRFEATSAAVTGITP